MTKTNVHPGGITVPTPTPTGPGTNDIRPIKPPVAIPGSWLPWVLGCLAAAAVGAALYHWLSRRRKAEPPPAPPLPPHVRARKRLEQALGLLSEPRLFCIAVSDAIRLYLEERFALQAPDRTTEEFLSELQHSVHLTPAQKDMLGDFLSRCDLVKFARFEPSEADLRGLHSAAERLVEETVPTVVVTYDTGSNAGASPPPPTPG
jgi:hypothetical protein